MGAFEKYFDGSYEPTSNAHRYIDCGCEEMQVMYVGGTCTHVFKFPFYCDDEDFDSVDVTYYQQDRVELVKHIDTIGDDDRSRFVECTLTPEETSMFDDRLLDCLAQVKATKNDVVLFSRIFKIELRRSLGGDS